MQFAVGKLMAIPADTVQAEVTYFRGGRLRVLERVHNMDEIEFLAQFRDQVRVPLAAQLPTHEKLAAFGLLEEPLQGSDVLFCGPKTGWTLEQHQKRPQRSRNRIRLVPGPAHGGIVTETATIRRVARIEPRPLICRAGGWMRDDLPCFQRELEILRCGCPPTCRRLDFRKLIETGIDLYAGKSLKIPRLREGKSAATDFYLGRGVGHDADASRFVQTCKASRVSAFLGGSSS